MAFTFSLSFIGLILIMLLKLISCNIDQELMCLICRAVVDEIESDIKKVNPKKTVQVGGYRLDSSGNRKKTEIQYATSEVHIHEILDELCNRLEDYAQAKYKDTGERTILKLIKDGMMNPDMGKVDIIPDVDLNAKLKYNCESIVDEYEDELIRIFTKKESDPDIRLCAQATGFCPGHLDEDDYDFEKDEL